MKLHSSYVENIISNLKYLICKPCGQHISRGQLISHKKLIFHGQHYFLSYFTTPPTHNKIRLQPNPNLSNTGATDTTVNQTTPLIIIMLLKTTCCAKWAAVYKHQSCELDLSRCWQENLSSEKNELEGKEYPDDWELKLYYELFLTNSK